MKLKINNKYIFYPFGKDMNMKNKINYIIPSDKRITSTYWNMYNRCYNDGVHKRKPYYTDVTMCSEWLNNKESFSDWMCENYYTIEGTRKVMELDHDILVKGSKIYSPETCCFVPSEINSMFGGSAKKKEKGLPLGVEKTKEGLFKPMVKGYTRVFDTPEQAWKIYAEKKRADIISVAQKYKGLIPNKLYYALWDWIVSIDD